MHIADATLTSPPRLQVRISCAGFPTKMLYEDFVDHFWNLVPHLLSQSDLTDSDIGRAIVDQAHLEGYQAGKTKVESLKLWTVDQCTIPAYFREGIKPRSLHPGSKGIKEHSDGFGVEADGWKVLAA